MLTRPDYRDESLEFSGRIHGTLSDSNRNCDIRKKLNVFSKNEKSNRYRSRKKDHLSRQSNNNIAKNLDTERSIWTAAVIGSAEVNF